MYPTRMPSVIKSLRDKLGDRITNCGLDATARMMGVSLLASPRWVVLGESGVGAEEKTLHLRERWQGP